MDIYNYADIFGLQEQYEASVSGQLRTTLYRFKWALYPVYNNSQTGGGYRETGSGSATVTIKDADTGEVLLTSSFSGSATWRDIYPLPAPNFAYTSWTSSVGHSGQIVAATGDFPHFLQSGGNSSIFGSAWVQATTADNLHNDAEFYFDDQSHYRNVTLELSGTVSFSWGINVQLVPTGQVAIGISNTFRHDWMEFNAYGARYVVPATFDYTEPISTLASFDWIFDQGQEISRDGKKAKQGYPGPNLLNPDGTPQFYTGTLTVKAANGAWSRHRFQGSFAHWKSQCLTLPQNLQCHAYHSALNNIVFSRVLTPAQNFPFERFPTLCSNDALGLMLTQDSQTGAWKLRHSTDFFKSFNTENIIELWPDNYKNATLCLLSNGGAATIAVEHDTNKLWFKRSPHPLLWTPEALAEYDIEPFEPVLITTLNAGFSQLCSIHQLTLIGSTRLIVTNALGVTYRSDDLGDTWLSS